MNLITQQTANENDMSTNAIHGNVVDMTSGSSSQSSEFSQASPLSEDPLNQRSTLRTYQNTAIEQRLLARCKSGDKKAWDTLVRLYEKCAYRFAYNLCKDGDAAAELTGRAFVRVSQDLYRNQTQSSFVSQLFQSINTTYRGGSAFLA